MSTQKIPSADQLLSFFQHGKRYPGESHLPIHMANIDYFIAETAKHFSIGEFDASPVVRQMIKMAQGEYTPEVIDNELSGQILASLNCNEEVIDMPVTKNELMLLAISIREYRCSLYGIQKREGKKAWITALLDQCNALEKKVLSNEMSHDSIYGAAVKK